VIPALLAHVLPPADRPAPVSDVDEWHRRHLEAARGSSLERAARGAFAMDRLGWAFASGYTEALTRLVPELGSAKAALCATETGGNHPRAIATTLRDLVLRGEKTFVTLGDAAEHLLVVASVGRDGDRNHLKLVRLPASRDGVELHPGPATPFVPEIPHARLVLEDVAVRPEEILEGDGYADYLKPFRTVEDLHVEAAALAHLARLGLLRGVELAALLTTLHALADEDPKHPAVHLALAGVQRQRGQLLAAADRSALPEDVRARLDRDAPLFGVASKARAARERAAWARLDAARRGRPTLV